ncbi:hypothetical protein [Novosphingobium guangzhouense]|uniref:hypothetical protein n=1 Tax=Novosphingobium guangzhouense TaxID=1850347 RepID=UPI000CCBE429|nr:hypothetical protein [Novosphingobium guangzhouense]
MIEDIFTLLLPQTGALMRALFFRTTVRKRQMLRSMRRDGTLKSALGPFRSMAGRVRAGLSQG